MNISFHVCFMHSSSSPSFLFLTFLCGFVEGTLVSRERKGMWSEGGLRDREQRLRVSTCHLCSTVFSLGTKVPNAQC